MGHRSDSVIALRGNLTEGYQAHGPYANYDDASDANDGYDGWLMGVEAPGQLVSLSLHGITDEAFDAGEFYFPRDWMNDEIYDRVALLFREWRDKQPAIDQNDLDAFVAELAKTFRPAPETTKVEVDL